MVEWLFKPKVQLGLLVNFAFVMFTLVSSLAGVQPAGWRPAAIYDPPPTVPYASLPPSAAPSKAVKSESGKGINVHLDNDLILVRKPGRSLVFSPSLNVLDLPAEQPPSVTMRFITSSDDDEICPGACMLVINADGKRVLESATRGTFSSGWKRERLPAEAAAHDNEKVVMTFPAETLTAQVPHDMFIEIIAARRVVISLGPDKVELTHDQIEVLRDMHRLVYPLPNADY